MKKITSLMMMLVLCCVGAYAQVATDFVDKVIKVGTAQAEMVPGQWYFLHTPRNPNTDADTHVMPGETQPGTGGFVYDNTSNLMVSTAEVRDQLAAEEGVNANDYMKYLVRFVAVEGEEGAYNIQFGNGKWVNEAPGSETMNNNSYIAGLAGKYNFYLIKLNGTPNSAGRFGWNKYNMQDRVDNNGAGNSVVFWASGETVPEGDQLNAEDGSLIVGNKIWQIYDVVELGQADMYYETFMSMVNTATEIAAREDGNYIDNLKNNINVGNSYGNYRPEDVAAFLAIHEQVEELIGAVDGGEGMEYVQQFYPTREDLEAFHNSYKAADEQVRTNKIPLAVNDIADGYYIINNPMKWLANDTIRYTQEEADAYNEENGYMEGEEGFATTESIKEVRQVVAPAKGLCSLDYEGEPWLGWYPAQQNSNFLWKIEKLAGSDTKYRLINMDKGLTFNGVPTSASTKMVENDTVTVFFDYRGSLNLPVPGTLASENQTGDAVTTYSIRNTFQGNEGSANAVHCGGHSAGAGQYGFVVGWYGDPEASRWYLTPVDEATADQWMNGDEAKVRKMVNEANGIVGSVPAQFEIAKDIKTTIFDNDSVVVNASQFYSQYTTEDQQKIPDGKTVYDFLIDGQQSTYWHSRWEDGDAAFKTHYLQIEANETLNGLYAAKITRRPVSGDHITKLAVKGYEEAPTDETTFEEGKDLATLTLPLGANNETIVSAVFDATGCTYLRFYSLETKAAANGGGSNRGYWHASEFNVFKAEQGTVYEKTQYQVRAAIISRLQAAMDAWTAANYSAEDASLINNEAFKAAYDELVAANEAWKAVYVDPAELREAVKAAPAANLFVIGNNPGQWKEGSVTPVATVNEAQAYDETGAYTPAESERLIKAIADVTEKAFDAANKVETGKWYRIKFPTEEMYDTYEWSKTGAKDVYHENAGVQQYPALFGKTAAAGKGTTTYVPFERTNDAGELVNDTVATYEATVVEDARDFANGNQIYFYEGEDLEYIAEGSDLFRFIQATDSSYIIQNKATGLFLRGGSPATLSDIPTYFYSKAIGAGANLITFTDVLGEKVQHRNLHGERSTNRLVCWEASNLGSNSGLLIEEVEAVAEEPATAYTTKLWPGSYYAYTRPVDITIAPDAGATAYGAELVVTETDTTVYLKKIEAETIKAGTPYILIADLVGEYITPADRLAEIAQSYIDAGEYGYIQKQEAAQLRDDEYAAIELDHGMVVDTLQKGNGSLVGTFRSLTVEAGQGLVTNNNGFKHTLVNTNVGAFGAYVKSAFDPESADVLGTIAVKIEGSIEDGIDQILGNVAKGGNIYTVDGKLVGKGNINAINNLPAGIYIVNGVKVTKK